jgi:predicted phage terminase large subunit-like protein
MSNSLNAVDIPLYVTLAIDPAVTAQDYSDATGITVVGEDKDGNWYILEADAFKGLPDAVVDRVAYHAQRYRPRVGSCEIIAAQRLYLPLFRARFDTLGISLPIREYRYSTRVSKRARIESLQPKFRNKKVFIRKGLDELQRQLLQYPETEHDDLLDALTQHLVISRPFNPNELAHDPDEMDFVADEDDINDDTRSKTNGTWSGRGSTRYAIKR